MGIWFARVVKALFFVALVGAVWGYEYLKRYDPFVHGSGSLGVSSKSDVEIDTLAGSQYLLRHAEGEKFYAWTTLHNEGRWAVTIERIKTPDFGEIDVTGVFVDPTWEATGDDLQAFEATRLDSGETLQLGIEMRYGPCRIGAGDSMGIDSLPMRYSLLGMTRHTDLDLGYFLIVRGYQGRVCADPDNPRLDVD